MFHFRKIFHSYGNTAGLIDRSTYFKDNPFKPNNDYSQTLCRILASKGALYMTLCYYAFKTQPSMCYILIYANI